MCKAAIVTGATGFLGSHLVAGMLSEDADVTVICLARPKEGHTAWERVVHAVRRAYRDRNGHDEPAGWAERVIVFDHDLGAEGVRPEGVADVARRVFEIGEFWHCAAAVEFTGERGGTVWRANVDGLRNALAIADKFGARVFNHVSTAYVAGKLTGRIAETLDPSPRAYNNIYEESKHVGEHYVARHCRLSKMNLRIFRPSIIIGHSRTRCTSSDAGLYQAVDQFAAFARVMRAKSPGYFQSRTLKVQLDRDGTLNMIPVDIAVAEMLDLATLGARTFGQVFHIISESPLSAHDAVRLTLEMVGVDRVEVVGPGADLNFADRMFNRSLKFYVPYFGQRKIFERSHVARHGVDCHQLGYLMDLDRLRSFIDHHLAMRRPAPVNAEVTLFASGLGVGNVLIPEMMIS
jgi:nucleoside-diphosphate-sugar epimerase